MNQCGRIRLILQENNLKQKELAAQLGGIQFTPQLIEKIASYVSVPVQENASTNNSVIFSSGRAAYCAAAETPAVEDLPEPSHFHRKA